MRLLLATSAALALATTAFAEEAVTYAFDGSFEDATFALESAILDQGLVIDYVSHVGDMLSRTASDVGSDTMLFDAAQVFLFCSAVVSREVMEADPLNIVHCPYGIAVTQRGDAVTLVHRSYPDGPMAAVETLLTAIVEEALAE